MDEKQLEQKRNELEKQLGLIRKELNKLLTAENKPLFEKQYNDTYWKNINSYGGGKNWFVYIHAKKVTSVYEAGYGASCRILCDYFQLTSENKLIAMFDTEMRDYDFENKITKKEFNAAVLKMANKITEAAK